MQNLQPHIVVDSLEEESGESDTNQRPKIDDQILKQTTKEIIGNDFPLHIERWDMKKVTTPIIIAVVVLAMIAGAATGWGAKNLQKNPSTNTEDSATQQLAGDTVKAGDIFGSNSDNFKDSAEGYLEKGGIDGEGSHKLIRTGGVSQTVYLTSSVTDLDKFAGMQVKVLGETYQGQKAGWLMDVGKVEVVNPDATSPATKE